MMSLVRFLGFTSLALRVHHRSVPGDRDQPRGDLRRGERHDLRSSRAPAEPHARARALRRRTRRRPGVLA